MWVVIYYASKEISRKSGTYEEESGVINSDVTLACWASFLLVLITAMSL